MVALILHQLSVEDGNNITHVPAGCGSGSLDDDAADDVVVGNPVRTAGESEGDITSVQPLEAGDEPSANVDKAEADQRDKRPEELDQPLDVVVNGGTEPDQHTPDGQQRETEGGDREELEEPLEALLEKLGFHPGVRAPRLVNAPIDAGAGLIIPHKTEGRWVHRAPGFLSEKGLVNRSRRRR
jgi:hypothetical protein